MTDEQIKRAVRIERRFRAVRDAEALRLVGAAVTVAAKAEAVGGARWLLGIGKPDHYRVPAKDMERLITAAREAGFKV